MVELMNVHLHVSYKVFVSGVKACVIVSDLLQKVLSLEGSGVTAGKVASERALNMRSVVYVLHERKA